MFTLNDDLSIYATRGDTVFFTVMAEENGIPYYFEAGDVLRMKTFQKKNATNLVLEKCFPVTAKTDRFTILLTEEDTKFGDVISKPTDYWYEIELNPFTNPQTIIGYDEDGAKVFRLFPEGKDSEEPEINPEDIPVVDIELDMTSNRPVQNQAIARAIVNIAAACKVTEQEVTRKANDFTASATELGAELAVERARVDTLVAGASSDGSEVIDIRVGADGGTYASAGTAVRSQFNRIAAEEDLFKNEGICYLKGGFEHGKIDNIGEEYTDKYRVKSISAMQYDRDISITIADGFKCAFHFYNKDGSYDHETGWLTGNYSIAANTPFRVVIARVTEDTTETAVIAEFIKKVTITTVLSELMEKVHTTELSLVVHESADMHLKSVIQSHNLVDPDEVISGGYYEFSSGNWIERSDISSTGLIACEKGQVYYCGINFDAVRGGNCTFWNSGGQYVSGLNVADGSVGFEIPDDDEIKYFRISFYTNEKSQWHVNLGEFMEYDNYKKVYVFDKEIATPSFDTASPFESKNKGCQTRYVQTYKDDVSVVHKRNYDVGTTYHVTVINKTKFDGTMVKVSVVGTSNVNPLGDLNNANVVTFTKTNESLHVINGGIYLVASGEADGITIINGAILKSSGVEQFTEEQYVLGITEDGEMKAYLNETAKNILADGSVYALTGFVPLIQEGVEVDSSVLSVCPHYNVRHPRQIIGILADGNYFTFFCDGRTDGENGMTLKECIDTIKNDFSVKFAFNLDGGGSTQTAVGKKQINRVIDGRTIPNVIAFK